MLQVGDFGEDRLLVAGYHSDMTRTFVLGKAADRAVYLSANARNRPVGSAAAVPSCGGRCSAPADADAGYGEHFGHLSTRCWPRRYMKRRAHIRRYTTGGPPWRTVSPAFIYLAAAVSASRTHW